jgi:hypothetical protein
MTYIRSISVQQNKQFISDVQVIGLDQRQNIGKQILFDIILIPLFSVGALLYVTDEYKDY